VEERIELGRKAYDIGLSLGTLGPVLIGAGGGTLAAALARSVGCGVALAGAEARFHDGSCEACGVWLAGYYGLSAVVFVRQSGSEVHLSVKDGQGRELIPTRGNVENPCTGRWDLITGADSGWAARRAEGGCRTSVVAAEGPPALKLLLERMSCDVLDRPRPGVPLLSSDSEGFRLTVRWNGTVEHPEGQDALAAAAKWLSRAHAVPAFGAELI